MLYCGDYREYIEKIDFDVIVTDPPYGIGYQYGDAYTDKGGLDYMELLAPLVGRPLCMMQYPEETMRHLVPIFGAPEEVFVWVYNSNTARQSRLVSFWGCDVDFGRVRVPAKNPEAAKVKSSHVAHYDWCSDIQQVKNVSEEKTDHPCQIPIRLMERILKFLAPKRVFDPFSGSGTTGVACANLGIDFVGCEIDGEYYEIARTRIKSTKSQERLFA